MPAMACMGWMTCSAFPTAVVRWPLALAVVLLAGMAGCARTERVASDVSSTTLPATDAAWPAGDRILTGFELGAPGDPWRAGDRVLLGLRAQRDGESSIRYLLVELTEILDIKTSLGISGKGPKGEKISYAIAPPSRVTRLSVFDESGKLLLKSDGAIPDKLLNNGLFGMLGANNSTVASAEPDLASERGFLGLMSLVQFSASSGGNKALDEMTRMIIERPSLWTLLTRRPTLSLNTTNVRPTIVLFGGTHRRAAQIGVDLSFNDALIAQVDVTAIESAPPLGIIGGMVFAEGKHPSDPTRRLHIAVLATRRGDGASFEAYTALPNTRPTTKPAE